MSYWNPGFICIFNDFWSTMYIFIHFWCHNLLSEYLTFSIIHDCFYIYHVCYSITWMYPYDSISNIRDIRLRGLTARCLTNESKLPNQTVTWSIINYDSFNLFIYDYFEFALIKIESIIFLFLCTSEILNMHIWHLWLHLINLVFSTCPHKYKWILYTENRFKTRVFKIYNLQI